ncbi:MAG: excinuclease ABC subunit UvrC [Thermoleophilia bacterium]|nr:excinuclease ABC subunit UvrC [Thermoleophilia bacterium]
MVFSSGGFTVPCSKFVLFVAIQVDSGSAPEPIDPAPAFAYSLAVPGQRETRKEREDRSERIVAERRSLPDSPGVYLFRDRDDEVIYVGKAISIRKRVASHFNVGNAEMTRLVDRIEFLVTENESDALITEQNFVKRHRPRFNIKLRDDKSYPYIAVSLDEEYPRVYFTRERHRTGRAYFGPFSSARRVRDTLDLLGKLFQYRTCEGKEPGRRSGSPCLDYFIMRCGAPCVGYIDQVEYRKNIDAVIDFLSGRYARIEKDLESQMEAAAAGQDFEAAAAFRDRLQSVRSLFERQRISGSKVGTADLIGVAAEGTDANAQVFQVRDGILAERQSFYLENPAERGLAEVTAEFIEQFYSASPSIPKRIVLGPYMADQAEEIERFLGTRRAQSKVEVRIAERGDSRRLRELAERNARLALDQDRLRSEHSQQRRVESLSSLAEALSMDELPIRIEGFDISNLGGSHTVASMVVFEGGKPKKSDYRRFRVRGDFGHDGPDDFASMEEILGRRLAQYREQADLSPHDSTRDESFAALPSLILIDGGKGQLAAGIRALGEFIEAGVTVIGLAKKLEEVYAPGGSDPIDLPSDSQGSMLLQRVRDEAHRFAISHHRGRRDRAMTESALDSLRGVGPARKRLLIKHFGTPDGVISASRAQIEAVPGLPGKVAREIHEQLNRIG